MKKIKRFLTLLRKSISANLKVWSLIASENFVSDEVMQAMGSYLTNKYAEGSAWQTLLWWLRSCGPSRRQLARERVKKLFGAEFANVQPHSGAQANAAVLLACT
jgi:glycine hydroxymethyltransferase